MVKCYVCGKTNLSKNEIGLTKKLISRNAKDFFCMKCLAEQLEVEVTELEDKIEEFKEEGCSLFQ